MMAQASRGGGSQVEEPRRSREGYLVLADIAGYTAFLTGNELEHAQGIIEECMALIRVRLTPPLRFVKLEGDARLLLRRRDHVCGRRTAHRAAGSLLLRVP
jgi:hypothetical protein